MSQTGKKGDGGIHTHGAKAEENACREIIKPGKSA